MYAKAREISGLELLYRLEQELDKLNAVLEQLSKALEALQPAISAPSIPSIERPVEVVFPQQIATIPVYAIDLLKYGEANLVNGDAISETVPFQRDRAVALVTARATYSATTTTGLRIYWLYGVDSQNIDTLEESSAEGRYVELGIATTVQRTVIVPIIAPITVILFKNDTGVNVSLKYWIHIARI